MSLIVDGDLLDARAVVPEFYSEGDEIGLDFPEVSFGITSGRITGYSLTSPDLDLGYIPLEPYDAHGEIISVRPGRAASFVIHAP